MQEGSTGLLPYSLKRNRNYGPLPGVAAARPEKSVTVDPTHVDSKLDRPEQKEDVCDDDDDDDDDESYCRDHAWSTPPTHEHSTRETGAERQASRASHDHAACDKPFR